jgi:hypothetical protein
MMGDFAYIQFKEGLKEEVFCIRSCAPEGSLIIYIIEDVLERNPDLWNNPRSLKKKLVEELDGKHKVASERFSCFLVTKKQYLEGQQLEYMPLIKIDMKDKKINIENKELSYDAFLEGV